MTNEELIKQGRMLTALEVSQMWKMSRVALWRLSNAKSEAKRLPSYKVGSKRLYKYDELQWYLDKHRTMPREKEKSTTNETKEALNVTEPSHT